MRLTIFEQIAHIEMNKSFDSVQEFIDELAGKVVEVQQSSVEVKGIIFDFFCKNLLKDGEGDYQFCKHVQSESEGIKYSEKIQQIVSDIESLSSYKVALVRNSCSGLLLEIALSCDYIMANEQRDQSFSLPQVLQGLIPVAGNVTHLIKRVGLNMALEMMANGITLNSNEAHKSGLVDELSPQDIFLLKAKSVIFEQLERKPKKKALFDFARDNFVTQKIHIQKFRQKLLDISDGRLRAPLKLLDVMEDGLLKGKNTLQLQLSQAFGELAISKQSINLNYVEKLLSHKSTIEECHLEIALVNPNYHVVGFLNNLILSKKRVNLFFDTYEGEEQFFSLLKDMRAVADQHALRDQVVSRVGTLEQDFEGIVIKSIDYCNDFPQKISIGNLIDVPIRLFQFKDMQPTILIDRRAEGTKELELLRSFFTPMGQFFIITTGDINIVERLLLSMLAPSMDLVAKGVHYEKILNIFDEFGMSTSVWGLVDFIGLDRMALLYKKWKDQDQNLYSFADEKFFKLIEIGSLGLAKKKGFFHYNNQSVVFDRYTVGEGHKEVNDEDLYQKIILSYLNCATALLSSNVITKTTELDLISLTLLKFPAFRGGVIKYLENEGVKRVFEKLSKLFCETKSKRYQPSDYFQQQLGS